MIEVLHSYYGLGAADMPSGQLIDHATSKVGASEKLKTVDVVIWDEASMSSARMLELVNACITDSVKMSPSVPGQKSYSKRKVTEAQKGQ